MQSLRAKLTVIKEGYIEIVLPFNRDYLQHTQLIHGSVIAGIADTACGYACISLAKENEQMLTLEYKINFLKPARGDYFTAKAKVLKNGARIKVSICEVTNEKADIIALMTASVMVMETKVTPTN